MRTQSRREGHLSFSRKKFYYTLMYVLLCTGGYFFTGTFQFFPEVEIQPSWVDRAIPYIPWAIMVYISYFVLMFLPLLICEESLFYRMLLAYLLVIAVSMTCFFFFPTQCFWPHAQCYGKKPDIFIFLCIFIQSLDTRCNACPSLHVSLSLTGALTYLWNGRYGKGVIFFIWGSLVAVSTLAIKQHFFIDVVAAFLMSMIIVGVLNIRGDKLGQPVAE